MDINLYLKRINYSGEITPSLEVLNELQKSHLMAVPFENLDIHNNVKIDLYNSFDKVVRKNRGGFCYELNGLFYALLKESGFKVKMVSARVYMDGKGYGAEFDHMVVIVFLNGSIYLADVGFGDFTTYPLKIETDTDLTDPAGVFRIEQFDKDYYAVKKKDPGGTYVQKYIFSLKERRLEDFFDMCIYHQTSSESHFTQNRLCSLLTDNGRITLTGNTLKITADGMVTVRQLDSGNEVRQVLHDYFGIENAVSGG